MSRVEILKEISHWYIGGTIHIFTKQENQVLVKIQYTGSHIHTICQHPSGGNNNSKYYFVQRFQTDGILK